MAILKSLLVQGPSRFLSTSYYNTIVANGVEADSIETNDFEANAIAAEKGVFTKLNASDVKATNLTVVGLLNTAGELHTTNWTNTNIASIEGSFSIIPTIGSSSGTVNVNPTAESLSFFGTSYAVDSLYTGDSTGAGNVNWTNGSKVIVTGEILVDGEYISLGTLRGTLGDVTTTTINIQGIKDNTNSTAEILTTIGSQTGATYRNLKVSLYERADSSNSYPIGIYLTALGANGKTFIDIYGGRQATSTAVGGGLASPVVRIGNLEGLPAITLPDSTSITPSGWGIYTSNGFFSGTIVSTRGKIGNFTLDTGLHAGTNGGPTTVNTNTVGVYVGTDGILNYLNSNAFVKVADGVITARGVDISGTIAASEGKIGPWFINSSSISRGSDGTTAGSYNTASNIYFGTSGLSLGTTFKVNAAGELVATGVDITGVITATSGTFTGTINAGAGYIGNNATKKIVIGNNSTNASIYYGMSSYSDTTTPGFYIGTDGIALGGGVFKVDSSGDATVKGSVTATSGVIGGWRIGTDGNKSLHNGNSDTSPTPYSGTVILSKGITTTNTIGNLPAATYAITAGTNFGVTVEGALYAASGKIGKWGISDGHLYYTSTTPGYSSSSVLISPEGVSSSTSIGGSGNSSKTWKLTIGTHFGVTSDGTLYANAGKIGGCTIDSNGVLKITDANIDGRISAGHIETSGITISRIESGSNYAQITTNGLEIINGVNSIAEFSSTPRIGLSSSYNLQLSSEKLSFYNNNYEVGYIQSATNGMFVGKYDASVWLTSDSGVDLRVDNNCLLRVSRGGSAWIFSKLYMTNYSIYLGVEGSTKDSRIYTGYDGTSDSGKAAMYQSSGGNLVVGYGYSTSGNCNIYGYNVNLYPNNKAYVNGSQISTSDNRLKSNIKSIRSNEELNKFILNLNPVSYNWRDKGDKDNHFGLVAQDVMELMDKYDMSYEEYGLVDYNDDNGYYYLSYIEFIPLLVNLCQSQQKEIDELKQLIKGGTN